MLCCTSNLYAIGKVHKHLSSPDATSKPDFGLSRSFGEPPTDSEQAKIEPPLLELSTVSTAYNRSVN